jgi:hypothetical protein
MGVPTLVKQCCVFVHTKYSTKITFDPDQAAINGENHMIGIGYIGQF